MITQNRWNDLLTVHKYGILISVFPNGFSLVDSSIEKLTAIAYLIVKPDGLIWQASGTPQKITSK
jgi:hypothetical protein